MRSAKRDATAPLCRCARRAWLVEAKCGHVAPLLQQDCRPLDLVTLEMERKSVLDGSHPRRRREAGRRVDDVANGERVTDHEDALLGSPQDEPKPAREPR